MSAGPEKPRSPRQRARIASAEFRAAQAKGLAVGLAVRLAARKCGARKRSDGEPCRQVALENGRCRYHGGLTPKGAAWHKPRWPAKTAPVEKLGKKLGELDRRRAAQEARRRAMTSDQREQHDAWRRAHAPGSPADRDRARRARAVRAELEGLMAPAAPAAPTALDAAIATLEARRRALVGDDDATHGKDRADDDEA